jgi:hypothetical protein
MGLASWELGIGSWEFTGLTETGRLALEHECVNRSIACARESPGLG